MGLLLVFTISCVFPVGVVVREGANVVGVGILLEGGWVSGCYKRWIIVVGGEEIVVCGIELLVVVDWVWSAVRWVWVSKWSAGGDGALASILLLFLGSRLFCKRIASRVVVTAPSSLIVTMLYELQQRRGCPKL